MKRWDHDNNDDCSNFFWIFIHFKFRPKLGAATPKTTRRENLDQSGAISILILIVISPLYHPDLTYPLHTDHQNNPDHHHYLDPDCHPDAASPSSPSCAAPPSREASTATTRLSSSSPPTSSGSPSPSPPDHDHDHTNTQLHAGTEHFNTAMTNMDRLIQTAQNQVWFLLMIEFNVEEEFGSIVNLHPAHTRWYKNLDQDNLLYKLNKKGSFST